MIEISPSGRAQCRGCKKPIAKGELRFAETYVIPGTDQEAKRYHHLRCAADNAIAGFKDALEAYDGEVEGKAALEEAFAKASSKKGGGKPSKFPSAERAPTGRAKCIHCAQAIAKGSWRVAIEREIDTGTFVTRGAGYLHPACAIEWARENSDDPDGFVDRVLANSDINEADAGDLRNEMQPA
jgi:hypothetical protein